MNWKYYNTQQPLENIYALSMSNNCETISQGGRHSIFKKHPLKYPSPWHHCLSQLHQGHPTMYTSFSLSYKILRIVGCQQKRPAISSFAARIGSGSVWLPKPTRSVPEPRGKGEKYVIALSHEWFNSSHWLRFLSLQCLQTTWGKHEESLQQNSHVIKVFANAIILGDIQCFILMSSWTS